MKKELLKGFIATLMIVAGSMNANAQEWNFSSGGFGTVANYTETATVDGLTMYAISTAGVAIDASNKSLDEYTFTYRLKLGGTGAFDATGATPVSRVLAFPVSGKTSIKIIATHSSSTGDNRSLVVAAGSKTNEIGRLDVVAGASPVSKTFEYTGGATTIYVFSASSGINLYLIKATTATGIGEIQKEAISTEYYNVTGIKANKNSKGVIVEKKIYSDGSICTTKKLNISK